MYYLGLDYGGTKIKAALYDEEGAEIEVAVQPSQVEDSVPQVVEIDMDVLWHSACLCIRSLLEKSRVKPKQIAGVSVCSHGKGLYLLGAKGRPCGKGILSADTRAAGLVQSWKKQKFNLALYPYILQDIWPPQPLALLAYLKQQDSQRLENSGHILMGHDYLRYCLTDEMAAERSNISGSGLVDIRKGEYCCEVLEQTELTSIHNKLCPIIESSALAGKVSPAGAAATGLLAGTPVYGGFFDVVGAAVASGLLSESDYHAIMGTWSISTCLASQIKADNASGIPWGSYAALPDMYFVHDGSPSSANNLNWFLKQFLPNLSNGNSSGQNSGHPNSSYNDQVLQSISPEQNSLFFYPYLYASNLGEGSPGTLIGLQSHHRYDDVLYAVYEGIVLAHLVHLQKLREIQPNPERLLLSGGPSQSRPWMQMFADFAGLPIWTLKGTRESGCKGAAMAAAVGSGHFANFPQAMAAWTVYDQPIYPQSARQTQALAAKYQRYVEIGRHIASLYP